MDNRGDEWIWCVVTLVLKLGHLHSLLEDSCSCTSVRSSEDEFEIEHHVEK